MSTRYVWGKYNTTQGVYLQSIKILHEWPRLSLSEFSLYYGEYGLNLNYPSSPFYLKTQEGSIQIPTEEETYSDEIPAGYYIFATNSHFVFTGGTYKTITATKFEWKKSSDDHYYLNSDQEVEYYKYAEDPIKDSFLSDVSGTSQSSYPSDGMQGSYWYTYLGSDSIDPSAVSYSTTNPKGGESITINVSPRSNTYGGTITYKYQVQLDGGSWIDIGSTTSTAKSYIIPKGTSTFRARVVASDNMGFTSTDYVTGNTCSVINNTAPSISGEDSVLGTFRYEYPTVSYTITDPDEQVVIRKIELDSTVVVPEESIVLGQEYTYTVTEEQMAALVDGAHTIKITATDSEGASAVRQYTFTKFFGSDTLYQRLRRLNDLGLYDTIYFENNASNIIRPNGMTVQETIDKIEADLAELEK